MIHFKGSGLLGKISGTSYSRLFLLDKQCRAVATKYQVPINPLFQVCELLRGNIGSDHYAIRSISLQYDLAEKFEAIEDEVIDILSNTQRTSGMIENLHSRIRPHSNAQKGLNQRFIDLLRFYLNHTPFLRSAKEHLKKKSPDEILFQQPHHHWLEMLGYVQCQHA